MERLAEQIVDWHNRHPLARRVSVGDVHTIGVVALPFVRTTAPAGSAVEPVLTDVVSAFDALHDQPPPPRWAALSQRLAGVARRLNRHPRTQWRAFDEKFLPGLSPARIERFALAHGFEDPPAAPESKPWRVIVIDEALAAKRGGWPFELYLMSAGIDAGGGRTRVLTGRGIPSQVMGRRIWDPIRLGSAAAVLALLMGGLGYLLWPRPPAPPATEPAAAEHIAAAASAPPSAPEAQVQAGDAANAAASAAEPASAPASAAEQAAANEPPASAAEPDAGASSVPDIRPRLVQRADGIERPPLRSSKPAGATAAGGTGKDGDKAAGPAPGKKAGPGTEAGNEAAVDVAKPAPADPLLARMAAKTGQTVVALVGPPGSKAEAEALLARMKAALAGVHGDPQTLQADVLQTPEGWRATVWPFPSREQAQLINATLVARGMKTKAVNF